MPDQTPQPRHAEDIRPRHWPYRADPPQRYNDNADLYLARGGTVRLEHDVAPFVADGDHGDISRFYFFCLVQDQIIKEGLEGDLAELGVYRGCTGALIATIARRTGRTAYLFDTFESFSPRDIIGIDAGTRQDQFADTSLAAVRQRVGTDNVRFIPGYFPDSTDQIPPDLRFCLVHIDCDLYEPILAALNYFYPRMVPGGFIIMHDYSSLAWKGAEQAIDEFFADKPEFVVPLTDGAGSAVVRRARDPDADLGTGWIMPGTAAFSRLLRDGWSALEPWGIWGIGASHTVRLRLRRDGAGNAALIVDCAAALPGPEVTQQVTVTADNRTLATWVFSWAENRAERRVTLPPGDGPLDLTFSVANPISPADHDPANPDTRPLGLALHRLRLAP